MLEWEKVNLIASLCSYLINLGIFARGCFKKYISWQIEKEPPISYFNDDFARETIKYRFNEIISKINKEVPEKSPVISYQEFLKARPEDLKFDEHPALQTYKNPVNTPIMKEWLTKFKNYDSVSKLVAEAPFIDVEHFYYFYVLSKTYDVLKDKEKLCLLHPDYDKEKQFDPYKSRKLRMLENDFRQERSRIKNILNLIIEIDKNDTDIARKQQIESILKTNLSANSSDSSQMFWRDFSDVDPIIDDSEKFWNKYCIYIEPGKTVNIIVDNFGIEFLSDLLLGYYLTKKGVEKIIYHVKVLPMFVSDVVDGDQTIMIKTLKSLIDNCQDNEENYKNALNNLSEAVDKFEFKAHYDLNMPSSFSDLASSGQDSIKSIFQGENLLIVKGDLNYRRLIKDNLRSSLKRTVKLIKYINCPLLVIRSYKSNTVLDFKTSDKSKIAKYGPDWKTEGKVGAILYYEALTKFRKCNR